MNKIISILIGVVIVIGAVWWFMKPSAPAVAPTTSASPEASASPAATPAAPAVTLTSPKSSAAVDSPILVTGTARVFENQLTVQVKDLTGKVVASNHVFTDAKDPSQFGNFSTRIQIPAGAASSTMKVEAFAASPKGDGSLQGYASVMVNLKYIDTSTVYAAFNTDPNDCTQVVRFPRTITKTSQFVYTSLVELLKGPNDDEKKQGAETFIPSGVEINSFHQTGDTGYVDLNQALQQGVAGSCRVQGIRAQIEGTLKQFLGLNNVVISIDGQTNGILQP